MRALEGAAIFALVLGSTVSAAAQAAHTRPATSLAISAVQKSASVGSPLEIEVVLTNNTNHDITVGRELSGMDCRVDVRDRQGKLPADTRFGYLRNGHADNARLMELTSGELNTNAVYIPVKAGETLTWKLDLNKLYVLNEPGKYRVQVHRRDSVDASLVVKSNTVTVTVIP